MTVKIKETYKVTTRYGHKYHPTIETLDIAEGDNTWFGLLTDMIKISFIDEKTTSVSIRRIKK